MRLPLRPQAVFIAGLATALLTIATWAFADTVNLGASQDNTLIETPVGNSNGAGDGIYVGRVGALGGGTRRRGVLAFDLSSIPSGATIDAVTLHLELAQTNDLSARTVTVHRLNASWGEGASTGSGSGGPASPGDATWLFRFFNSVGWTTAGGEFVTAPSASQSVGGVGPYTWTGAGLVADVQSWVDNPASNFGWLLKDPETTTTTARKYYSRDVVFGGPPPRLTIDYTPSATDVATGPDAGTVSFAAPWPAPASGRVNLSYALPRAGRVSLLIYDAMGRLVRRLAADLDQPAGVHTAVWDGRTDSGTPAVSGVYLASLVVDQNAYRRRIPLVR